MGKKREWADDVSPSAPIWELTLAGVFREYIVAPALRRWMREILREIERKAAKRKRQARQRTGRRR